MISYQGRIAGALMEELMEVIQKYDEAIYMSTVIGVLELLKMQLVQDNVENDNDD